MGFQLRLSVFSVLVLVVRVFWGFQKNKWVLAGLVGLASYVCHVLHYSINFNAILGIGGNSRAIGCNWGEVNRVSWKFERGIEKVVIVEGGKV